jgi:hypothetical protein
LVPKLVREKRGEDGRALAGMIIPRDERSTPPANTVEHIIEFAASGNRL